MDMDTDMDMDIMRKKQVNRLKIITYLEKLSANL